MNITKTVEWIRADYNSNPARFWIELTAWVMSIGANIAFAMTVPNVPFYYYLTITITSCAMYAWAAWSRKSFGMLANYLLLTTVDSIGMLRLII